MDDATVQGTLAYAAYKIETERKRELAEELASRQFRQSGRIDVDRLRDDFEAAWEPSDPDHLANQVASYAAGAIVGYRAQLDDHDAVVASAQRKVEKAEAALEGALAGLATAKVSTVPDELDEALDLARALASAATGDPESYTPSQMRSVPHAVAEAVAEVIGEAL